MTRSEPPRARSAIEGEVWPGVPGAEGASVLALLFQLDRTQWLDPETLRARQFAQAERLYAHACATTPYYAERWRDWDVEPGRRLDAEAWSRLPVLTRRLAQEQADRLLSERPPPSHGAVGAGLTSGSTGAPLSIAATQLTRLYWRAFTLRDHFWQGRDFAGRLAAIRTLAKSAPYPDGVRSPSWGEATAATLETGPSFGLDIDTKVSLQAEWLRRRDPDYLLTHPSNLAALLAESPRRPPRLRLAATVSEALAPEIREACRSTWNIEIADIYSSEEVGYIALQCPSGGGYHVQAEGAMVEVLHPDGRPCAPGEVGQVTATPLHNFAMPLLRYALGDLAEVGAPCPCGRGLPTLTRILGRVRNMVRLPGGERHYPNFGGLMRGIEAVLQFQIVRKAADELEARLVVARPLPPQAEAELTGRLRERFQHPFRVRFVYLAEIPRSPRGKYEDFRSELDEDQLW